MLSITTDYAADAGIIAASSYTGCVSMESSVGSDFDDEAEFLAAAFQAGTRFAEMIDQQRA